MIKKVLSVVMAIAVLFAICACNGNSDLLKKVEELESTVQSQSEKITELEGKNKQQSDKVSELETQNKQLAGQLSELDEQNRRQADRISELEIENRLNIYNLDTAYEYGWLTTEDLMIIANYYYEYDQYTRTQGATKPEQPEELDEKTETRIKAVYRRKYLMDEVPSKLLSEIHIDYCYGTYHNCIIVAISVDHYPLDLWIEPEYEIGGVIFKNYCPNSLQVYRKS